MAAAAQVGLGHITAGHLCQPGAAAQPHLGKDRRLVSPRPYLVTEPCPSEFHQSLTATCMLIKFVEKGNLFSCLEDRVQQLTVLEQVCCLSLAQAGSLSGCLSTFSLNNECFGWV